MANLPKIIVIAGPTASGKTDLGIKIAKQFNGEIISADSRQVYKKMNIGTAKPAGEWRLVGDGVEQAYFVEGVPHYLMDIVEPDEEFTLAHYKKLAQEKIDSILKRGKLPIIVGGTGLYIWSIVDNLDIPAVVPDKNLRSELEKKSNEELITMLKEADPESLNVIDLKNPRRVLRALEVVLSTGESFVKQRTQSEPLYNSLQLALNWPREELNTRINRRVDQQIEEGLVKEVEKLVEVGYGWNLPSMSGIGYKQVGYYLRGEMGLPEAIEEIKKDTRHYAKRQMTWFRREEKIKWIERDSSKESVSLISTFCSN